MQTRIEPNMSVLEIIYIYTRKMLLKLIIHLDASLPMYSPWYASYSNIHFAFKTYRILWESKIENLEKVESDIDRIITSAFN